MIFPDWDSQTPSSPSSELPLFTEWVPDFQNHSFALKNGDFYTVSGLEALKIWILRALQPEIERFRYSAWSHDYGNELSNLLGGVTDQGILESRLKHAIQDTLLVSPYISNVDQFAFSKDGSCVTVHFTVHSVYGDDIHKLEVQIG